MRFLVDTNILTRLAQPSHLHHATARHALEYLRLDHHHGFIVPQVVYEFWVAGTRPAAENGLGFTIEEVIAELAEIKTLFRLFRDERTIYEKWEHLVETHRVSGKPAHDARLVAAMARHGLTNILTFNAQDFTRYAGVTVLTPDDVIQAAEKTKTRSSQ